jgi:outer membrane protein TolC
MVLAAASLAGAEEPTNPYFSRLKENNLPSYEDLKFSDVPESKPGEAYLPWLTTSAGDLITSGVIFPAVPDQSAFARLTLGELVQIALENNFDLVNSRRSIDIARSQVNSAEADFIPYLDLIGESRYTFDRNANATRSETGVGPDGLPATTAVSTTRDTDTVRNRGGVESGVTLPWGGQVTADATTDRTDTYTSDGGPDDTDARAYTSRTGIRYLQPLLRGAGSDIAQADLRRSRLQEADEDLGYKLSERDILLDVIETYYQLLQTARQLQVSNDAIRIRDQFLAETEVKFSVGRVDESEILRAEIQALSEQETAIGRIRALENLRDQLLLLLGLPLDTQISFLDLTEKLVQVGRLDPGEVDGAVNEALNSRMELMRQDIVIALAEIDTRIARNGVLPQLDLDAGYNRNDESDVFRDAYGMENQGWDAGLAFRMPLVNIDRREAAKRALIALDQRRTSRLQAERRLIAEVLSNHRTLLTTEAQLTLLRKNVEQARKSLELINGKFEVGFATVTEVRLAQDDLFSAETRYSDAILNYQIQIARLYVALGRPLL